MSFSAQSIFNLLRKVINKLNDGFLLLCEILFIKLKDMLGVSYRILVLEHDEHFVGSRSGRTNPDRSVHPACERVLMISIRLIPSIRWPSHL